MKICVIGYSGSGKSTLARILGDRFGLPVLHLDATFWYGEWQSRSREKQSAIVREFMENNAEGWVIDGNYTKVCADRFVHCDKMYFLNYNRFFCYRSAKQRYKKYKGTVRPDCPCAEKFDFEFIKWLLFKGRTLKRVRELKSLVSNCTGQTFTFKNRKQLNRYLETIK